MCRQKVTCIPIFQKAKRRHTSTKWMKPKCLDCMYPSCANPSCKTCKVCKDAKCTQKLSCKGSPESFSRGEVILLQKKRLCATCRTLGLSKCSACKRMVPKYWTNHGSWKHDVKRLDCLHPQCSSSTCTTCKSCRDVECNAVDCKKTPKALNNTDS